MGLCKAIGHGGQREPVNATVAFMRRKEKANLLGSNNSMQNCTQQILRVPENSFILQNI